MVDCSCITPLCPAWIAGAFLLTRMECLSRIVVALVVAVPVAVVPVHIAAAGLVVCFAAVAALVRIVAGLAVVVVPAP